MIGTKRIESYPLKNEIKEFGFLKSFLIFGVSSAALYFETHFLIPLLSEQTGFEPIIFWFIVSGFGLFLPLLVISHFILKSEGFKIGKVTWESRLRFKRMNKSDWKWSIGSIITIGILSFFIIKIL